MRALPGSELLAQVLTRPLPYSSRPMPLRDAARDPGLFGPDSVTWRVMREPLLILGAGRALLMQAANPLVAQGALDHSGFDRDPYGRLERTIEWVTLVSFGTTAEAGRASAQVNALRRRVVGRLPVAAATRRLGAGSRYSASDLDLLRWVHASFVDTMLVTHDALVGGLDDAERDAFVREWHAVAALMGVPRRLLWPDAASMRAYFTRQVARGAAVSGAGRGVGGATVPSSSVRAAPWAPGWGILAH